MAIADAATAFAELCRKATEMLEVVLTEYREDEAARTGRPR